MDREQLTQSELDKDFSNVEDAELSSEYDDDTDEDPDFDPLVAGPFKKDPFRFIRHIVRSDNDDSDDATNEDLNIYLPGCVSRHKEALEVGLVSQGEVLVADVIDSDSWRLWPSGDKRLMKDKQVYRNLVNVTQADLDTIKNNFKWIEDQLGYLTPPSDALVVILMGSPSDEEHCTKILKQGKQLGLNCQLRCTSAHKGTQETLQILAEYEGSGKPVVLVAVAGRSNGLGPVLSGNSVFPVINCPPVASDSGIASQDIWSSLRTPSGLGCTTVLYPEAAAVAAAQILALHDHILWARLRVKALNNYITLKEADKVIRSK